MHFETVRYAHQSSIEEVPRVKLVRVEWDDFGYSTLFEAFLVDRPGALLPLGRVKILEVGAKRTTLPKVFDELGSQYASLGQSLDFYEALEALGKVGTKILLGLRDVTAVPRGEGIDADPGFRDSLLRSPSAQLAYDLRTKQSLDSHIAFRWFPRFEVIGHEGIEFHFDAGRPFGRIIVLVGENAAGKTQALARLALALSGARRAGEVSPNPGFARVLAVSFSAFDDFPIPKLGNPLYDYSGLRNFGLVEPWRDRGRVDVEHAFKSLSEQRRVLLDKGRKQQWHDVLTCAGVSPEMQTAQRLSTLSSGQKFAAFVLTNLVAKLQKRSIVLFDEPELHTHPRMLSGVMRALHHLLEDHESFAILSTHSPIVLQEVPARSVRIFKRVGKGLGDAIAVSEYPRESFGAPLDEIERFAFQIDAEHRNFQKRLEELVAEGTWSREDIESTLQEPISMSTRVLLERFKARS